MSPNLKGKVHVSGTTILNLSGRFALAFAGMTMLLVASFVLFGNLAGYFSSKLSFVESVVTASAVAIVLAGVALGILLALPAIAFFGTRYAAITVGIAGTPLAILSLPPSADAVAANGGKIAYTGAVSSTLIAALATFVICKVIVVSRRGGGLGRD